MPTFSFQRASTTTAFRISPTDTNYFAVLFDPAKDQIEPIFERTGGELRQPVVARRVERITVIPQLDDHPIAPEQLDEVL